MFFIGGIATGRKDFPFRQTIICPKCGRLSSISVFMVYTYFSFFFIPLFKWGKKYFAASNCCNAIFSIDPALGRTLEQGEQIELRPEDLSLVGMDASQAVHCADCGYLLSPEYEFCPKCGKKL